MKPIVHFADFRCSDAENLQQKFARLLKTAGLGKIDLADKFVAIKLHFGEAGNMSYLRPNWVKTLADFVKKQGLDPQSREGKVAMLQKIQSEIDSYRTGGVHQDLFPDRWLPAAVIICDEPFSIANKMMNSTMKIVRGKVEEHYADRLAYAYTPEGKQLLNEKNIASI